MALRKEGEKVFEEEQRKFLKEDNTPDKKKLREADKKSREYSEDPPRPPQETTPPPEQQQQQQQPPPDQPPAASTPSSNNIQSRAVVEEDDHFGQLSFSLGTPEYPEELTLSDESFGVHINSYSTTMVTFYVPWEPHCDGVMHYMLQAMDDLPEGSDSSMAVVNCADYPDLCSSYGIVTYPTVLLFRASPNDWIPYKGMMDSRQMLKALLHQQAEDTTEHGLVTHNYRWNL
ncbi:Protein disulfide-isomerase [Geodia barretti]|nr:Protein disulfide-isomerase [Geodia barretti]